ncbi:hypothetical protein HNP92_001829 [Methanococcus maripaludis]|uniref:Uncharacterized protein n=1 Tax=Methanococcus maripaludis TaxID=39152 RepID=A0A7J9S8Z8_METMI|nr:hypothetical protein [Methanococcus maripaludis]MBB6402506.1 hypothetical protein [Methanococcus maripaludis]
MSRNLEVIHAIMELEPKLSFEAATEVFNRSSVPTMLTKPIVDSCADAEELAEIALFGL